MVISILTLFPQALNDILSFSILKKAREKNLIKIELIDIRNFTTDKHRSVDDKPYGGGVGMLMKVDVLDRAISYSKDKYKKYSRRYIKSKSKYVEKVILMDPKGKVFTQKVAYKLSTFDHLIIVCGHYEGVDARIYHYIDQCVSIGKYVLTGGEIPSLVLVDCISRLVKDVLPSEALENESFNKNSKLEYPQYTRPEVYKKNRAPKVLLSGNHKYIENWKKDKKNSSIAHRYSFKT